MIKERTGLSPPESGYIHSMPIRQLNMVRSINSGLISLPFDSQIFNGPRGLVPLLAEKAAKISSLLIKL